MRTLLRLLRALALLAEEAVAVGLLRELAIRLRTQRYEAAAAALEARDDARARALAEGDVDALDAELADLDRALDDGGVLTGPAEGGRRR